MTEQQQFEIELQEAKDTVALAEALDKLHTNGTFKKIILKGFFEDAANFNDLANNPQLPETAREGARNMLVGITALKQYFSGIYQKGESAKNALAQLDEEEFGTEV